MSRWTNSRPTLHVFDGEGAEHVYVYWPDGSEMSVFRSGYIGVRNAQGECVRLPGVSPGLLGMVAAIAGDPYIMPLDRDIAYDSSDAYTFPLSKQRLPW